MITMESLKGKLYHQFPLEVRELILDVRMKFGPQEGTPFQEYLEGQAARIHELTPIVLAFASGRAKIRGVELTFPELRSVA